MKVKRMQVGPIGTNCYLLEDEETGKAAVIDPGEEADRILAQIKSDQVKVEYILLTHGHYDHTTAVPALHAALPDAKIYIHAADANGAGSRLFPLSGAVKELHFYDEGDTLTLGSLTIHVMYTPGHSKGSVTLLVEDVLFTGDTLFAGSCGRTDLPGGDPRAMRDSLRRLAKLEGNFFVHPGHGPGSTLDREKQTNPYL